jgi:hypothetical protein
MTPRQPLFARLMLLVACVLVAALTELAARQQGAAAGRGTGSVAIDLDDIGGVVTGPDGPEAGVWVIAETTETPTRLRKIVVTDDQGRYVIPDLPSATYQVWVRGYGLVDSPKTAAKPGTRQALRAVAAPDRRAAAQIYPANYWYSLIEVPQAREFPGTGPTGNGIAPAMTTQAHWIGQIKAGCNVCHQVGDKATREVPPSLGPFASTAQAWDRRVRSGQDGTFMSAAVSALGRDRAIKMFADWTDRVMGGEIPEPPPRPQGEERTLVITEWDWGVDSSFVHDEVATDKRTPTINANGPIYGVDYGNDLLLTVDPRTHKASSLKLPVRDPLTPSAKPQQMAVPSPYWGEQIYWTDPAHPHNPMMDAKGRVWITQGIRPSDKQPAFCTDPANPYAKNFPLRASGSHASVYDPKSGKVTLVDTCFGTHHLQFGFDRDNTIYFSGDVNVVGWLNTRVFDETGDVQKAEGWCPVVVDHNGDGRIGEYTEPNESLDARKDQRLTGFAYGIVVNPVDGSVWYAVASTPGVIVRLDIGSNPPATCRSEVYEPPFNNPKRPGVMAYTPRGIDVDRNGVIWTGLAGSGHLASFDRRKCSVTNGPAATGQHCPDGWTLYRAPGPPMRNASADSSADFFYYNWVDQFDTLGLGANVPIANGSASDSLLVLKDGKFLVLRVPYPLGFYSRGLDGRIDNPAGGWKGRGVYANYGPNAIWHAEGGLGTKSALVKFQMRPSPLAK